MTRVFIAALLVAATTGLPISASAQQSDSEKYRLEQDARVRALDANDARRTLAELPRLLEEHPPAIRTVLRADPSLLERADYLAPYPRLAAFFKQHPEVARIELADLALRAVRHLRSAAIDSGDEPVGDRRAFDRGRSKHRIDQECGSPSLEPRAPSELGLQARRP